MGNENESLIATIKKIGFFSYLMLYHSGKSEIYSLVNLLWNENNIFYNYDFNDKVIFSIYDGYVWNSEPKIVSSTSFFPRK